MKLRTLVSEEQPSWNISLSWNIQNPYKKSKNTAANQLSDMSISQETIVGYEGGSPDRINFNSNMYLMKYIFFLKTNTYIL